MNQSTVKVRAWNAEELLPTSKGYLFLPDISYPVRDIFEDGGEDEDGFQIEIFHGNEWIKVCNIDFE